METLKQRIAHHEEELTKAQAKVKEVRNTIRILTREQTAIDKPKAAKKPSIKTAGKKKATTKKKGK